MTLAYSRSRRGFFKGLAALPGFIWRSSEIRYFDPVRVQTGLAMLDLNYWNGDIDKELYEAEKARFEARFKAIWERRRVRDGGDESCV